TIVARHADPGDFVAVGTPVFQIMQLDPIVVRIEVGARDIVRIRPGQTVDVRVDAFPGRVFSGEIWIVESVADPMTRLFGARILIPNPDLELKAGMSAQVTVTLAEVASDTVVPESALQGPESGRYVYVFQDG